MKSDVNADKKNRAYYQETFNEVHASQALAGKVMNMANKKEKTGMTTLTKKMAVAAAVLAFLLVGSNGVVYAATGSTWIGGVFRDITDFTGAITGTEYVQATEEVDISVGTATVQGVEVLLPLELKFSDKDKIPFRFLEGVSVAEVKVVDANGADVDVTLPAEISAMVVDGAAQMELQLSGQQLTAGKEYRLILETFYGLSKADQPLGVKGYWECEFIVK